MTFWSYDNLQQTTQGRWLNPPADLATIATGLSIDTRTLTENQAYLAIVGDRLDGHRFLEQAVTAGAKLVIVSDQVQGQALAANHTDVAVLQVDDTLAALQQLARVYRDHLRDNDVKVIAVTGSNGKTTTRHLIYTVLANRFTGTQSPKSFNNHIGLPLTLLAANIDDDFVVAEIGTNHPGEIDTLTRIAQPDAAVITHIGRAHIGQFGSREAIAAEKACILNYLTQGLAVIPGDEPLLDPFVGELPSEVEIARVLEPDDIRIDSDRIYFMVGRSPVRLPMLGRHNARNAQFAAAVGRWMNIDDDNIAGALGRVDRVDMRLNVDTLGKGGDAVTVLNDAYNANPDSVAAAIETLADYPLATAGGKQGGRRVLVLADMLELGDQAADLHRDVAKLIVGRTREFGLVVLIGEQSSHTAELLNQHLDGESVHAYLKWDDQLPNRITELFEPGDVVLLKGSRGMALERLLPAMKEKFGA